MNSSKNNLKRFLLNSASVLAAITLTAFILAFIFDLSFGHRVYTEKAIQFCRDLMTLIPCNL